MTCGFCDQRHLGRPQKGRGRLSFGWYGGKFSHLSWILPQLPSCHHYVEPYGGSAAVLLNRIPSPLETYNDIDGEVVNFFRVLRGWERDDLLRVISLTPFSRSEYLESLKPDEDLSDLERARRFYVRTRQVRSGLGQNATPGRWAYCKTSTKRGMSCSASKWLGGIEGLEDVARRLMMVQIECLPALDILKRYDGPDVLFYLDPPYCHDARIGLDAYGPHEMSSEDHTRLADVLKGLQAKVAISGYHSPLMDDLYSGWRISEAPAKKANSSLHSAKRSEVLWMNYDAEA